MSAFYRTNRARTNATIRWTRRIATGFAWKGLWRSISATENVSAKASPATESVLDGGRFVTINASMRIYPATEFAKEKGSNAPRTILAFARPITPTQTFASLWEPDTLSISTTNRRSGPESRCPTVPVLPLSPDDCAKAKIGI